MKQVLVLGGMTATGKSELAIRWAKAFNGEIISVDSVAIYRQLTIASAKVKPSEYQGIVHHGIDLSDVSSPWTVKQFVDYTRRKIDEIHTRQKLPILVGGSGLYLKAILYDYEFAQQSNDTLQPWASYSNEALHAMLTKQDPQEAAKLHPNNRKRIERALTIIAQERMSKSEWHKQQKHTMLYDVLLFVLDGQRQHLYERINARVDQMIAAGLQDEIQAAHVMADWDYPSMAAIGVKEWQPYFNNEVSLEDVIETIKTRTRQFSKRQRTWFKNQFDGEWLDFNNPTSLEQASERIQQWIAPFHE